MTNSNNKKYFFKHLNVINQSYGSHFCDAMKYCGMAFKASFFFFVHAFWPDFFISNGSETIFGLNEIIVEKYRVFNEQSNIDISEIINR
jgi:hypothetical protein